MKRFVTILLMTCLCLAVHASEIRDITVKHIGIEQGLSHHSVNTIWQDEHGFIWIGTMDGLNRYDGQKFKVFKPDANDPGSIMENNIRIICGDMNGHLYVKGLNSLSEFDMKSHRFRVIAHDNIRNIFHDGSRLWVADTHSLSTYDRESGTFTEQFCFPEEETENVSICCFITGHDGRQYISTSRHGFYIVNRNGNIIRHLNSDEANSIFEDSKGNIWIATKREGIHIVMADGSIRHFRHTDGDSGSLPHNNVRAICEDDSGCYWLSTYEGLSKLDLESGSFTHYRYEFKHEAFSIRSITPMIYDRQGTLWIGSFYEGCVAYNPSNDHYRYYRAKENSTGKLNSSIISSIAEDEDGNLYIGTEGGGVNYLDRRTGRFSVLTQDDYKMVKSILYDRERQALYIATMYDGVGKYDLKTGRMHSYKGYDDDGHRMHNIVCMKEFGRDSVLLAANGGLFVMDKKTGRQSRIETGFKSKFVSQVWDIETEDNGNIWFTTSSELYCYNIVENTTRYYTFHDMASEHINNHFNQILKDSKGRLWFGSSGSGFFLYERSSDTFRMFGSEAGMKNGYITGLCEDPQSGMICIATNKGLATYDAEEGIIRNYDTSTGFPLQLINENSMHVTSDGELFACDMNGLVSVKCSELDARPRDYSVMVSGLSIDNEPVIPGAEGSMALLREDILFQKEISISPKHSSVSFEISNTDYLNPSGPMAEYMLVGFDSGFTVTSGTNAITYTNLNPGRYTFIVRGLTCDTEGRYPSCEISMTIETPFWKTFWFISLLVIALLSIIIYISKTYITSIRLRSMLEYEKKEKACLSEANRSKMRFFTNISHEFRTPLTLIDGQLEMLLQRNDLKPSVYSKILNIWRNSQRMRRLVDEIIDIRKQEDGKMKLKVSTCDMASFMKEIFVSFEEYARYRNVSFTYSGPDHEGIPMTFDPEQMEKVFFNLLSNAFKYTVSEDSIETVLTDDGENVKVEIRDSGAGISPEHLPHIFERFYQDEKLNASVSGNGSGVGLSLCRSIVEMHGGHITVESEEGKGSCFTITLPKEPAFPEGTMAAEQERARQDAGTMKMITHYTTDEIPDAKEHKDHSDAKMLIVEDNPEVRDMLVQIFSPIYETITAEDGESGIQKTLKENPDIILSDVMMPGISGFEMCSRLKSNLETCHIPIVLLTARTAENDIIEGLQTRADDYVTKPFNIKILVTRCNNLIEGRRRLQQKYLKQPDAPVKMLATNAKDKTLLENAVNVVTAHIDDHEFKSEVFAKELGLSRTYLFSKIKGLTGQSPNEFIQTIRLKHAAAKLIASPEESMAEIAYSCGFSSPSYFIKCFKSAYGKTPAMYRKEFVRKDQ